MIWRKLLSHSRQTWVCWWYDGVDEARKCYNMFKISHAQSDLSSYNREHCRTFYRGGTEWGAEITLQLSHRGSCRPDREFNFEKLRRNPGERREEEGPVSLFTHDSLARQDRVSGGVKAV